MEKLQLHEIAGYLPYRLTMYTPYGFRPNGKESTGKHRIVYLTGDLYADLENNTYQGVVFKPILRPLSDLRKFSEKYDRTFAEQMSIEEDIWFNDEYTISKYLYELANGYVKMSLKKTAFILKFLYMNHFDVESYFNHGKGLIERNLAVDINTLNNE